MVTGEPGGPWTVEFRSVLGGQDVEPLGIYAATLSFIQRVTEGGPEPNSSRAAIEGMRSGYVRVYREGSATNPLTVHYTLSYDLSAADSATPGSDFVLAGSVTIPAGAASADILVQPFDDEDVEGTEHFHITLIDPIAAMSANPAFQIGWPAVATATILDNDFATPRPTVRIDRLQDAHETAAAGSFRVTLSAAALIRTHSPLRHPPA